MSARLHTLILLASLSCRTTPPPPPETCGKSVTLRAPDYAEPLAPDAIAPALDAMLVEVQAWATSERGDYVMGLHDSRTLVMLAHEFHDKQKRLEAELDAHPELRGYLTLACLAAGAPELDCSTARPREIVAALKSEDETSRRARQRALFAQECRVEDVGRFYAPRFEPPDPVVRAVERCGSSSTRAFLPTVNRYHVSRVRCGDEDAVLVTSEVNTWWEPAGLIPDERRSTRVRPVMIQPMNPAYFDAAMNELDALIE